MARVITPPRRVSCAKMAHIVSQNPSKMKFSILASVSAAACLDSDFSCLGGADVRSLNDDLCRQMKGMVGCSLRESCKSTPDKPFCNENVIYATLCQG